MLVHSLNYNLTTIEPQQVITHNFKRSDLKEKQWLAVIVGICPKWGFKRNFINSQVKESNENFMLQRNVYMLEPYKVYQYKGFLIDDKTKKFDEGFFACTALGVIELEYEQVRLFLKMPVKSWYHKREFKTHSIKGKYADEKIPF